MNRHKNYFYLLLLLVFRLQPAAAQPSLPVPGPFEPRNSPWDLAALYEAPKTYPTDSCKVPGFRGFFYEGTIYKARPARVFAYYKTPPGTPPAGGWPAVVCVHGGGGTAFSEWVQAWVDHGYAAIAMDLEGHLPKGTFPNREWHEYGGPPRITTFGDIELADREQWFYQAVADVIRANSLLRSFPEINKDKIGIHGISWGGVITSAVMGLDHRFAFAMPVYGCGFLYLTTSPGFKKCFDIMSDSELETYKAKWDPSNYLPGCTIPVLGYIGSNDPAFPLDIWQRSILLTKGKKMFCIPTNSQHGHIWDQREIFAFADAIVRNGRSLVQIGEAQLVNGIASVRVSPEHDVRKTTLCFTSDSCDWQHRRWQAIPATMKDGRVSTGLPGGTTAFYFDITDDQGLVFSSAYRETNGSPPPIPLH